MSIRKYKQIVSSIKEVRLTSRCQSECKKLEYLSVGGHIRVLALKELGMSVGLCLFAKDVESYSYNHHVSKF